MISSTYKLYFKKIINDKKGIRSFDIPKKENIIYPLEIRMIHQLIKIANSLDAKGYYNLASEIDAIVTKAAGESSEQERLHQLKILEDLNKRLQDPNNSPERISELQEAKRVMEERLELNKPTQPTQSISGDSKTSYYLIEDETWRIVPQTGYAHTKEDGLRLWEHYDGEYSLVEKTQSPMERREKIIQPSRSFDIEYNEDPPVEYEGED